MTALYRRRGGGLVLVRDAPAAEPPPVTALGGELLDRWLPILLETGRVFELEVDAAGRVRVAVAEGTSAMPVPGADQLPPPHEPGDAHIHGPRIRAARR